MNKCWMLALGVLAVLAGCESESAGTGGTGGAAGTGGTGGSARTCATDIAVGEVQAFGDPTPLVRSEGITFDADGTLYVSVQDPGDDQVLDQLVDVAPDGSNEKVAEAESMLGLESDARGIVAAGINTSSILLIDPSDGSHVVIASGPPLVDPNFVVTTAWDTILVSDDRRGEGTIYEVTWEGDVSTWVEGVPSPNGMVFSLDGSTLYVAATFEDLDTSFEEVGLWTVTVSNGEAGTPEKWVDFDDSSAPDGVAIDSEGNVYVALNTAGQIAKVDLEGNVTTLATGLLGPASLAFGQGEFDPCSLYATSLFGNQLSRIGAGIPGTQK